MIRQRGLNNIPGDEWIYSNTNYFLLGIVVRRATKKSLSKFAVENMFQPLAMSHTLLTYDQFIDRLEKARIEFALFRRDGVTYVEVGHFGYSFDEQGHSSGGWITSVNVNWRDEWRNWMALLR